MRLATLRHLAGTRAAVRDGERYRLLPHHDVGEVLRDGALDRLDGLDGGTVTVDEADHAPLVLRPDKIVCVGVNYADHIAEMGREPPAAPTYFAKYARALVGHGDVIRVPSPDTSTHVDWEVELAVVIGSELRDASPEQALRAIAGYTILNDVSIRDYQRRTSQFLAGKTFEGTTPLGPELVTPDELPRPDGAGLGITCSVDGQVKQQSTTSELVFGVIDILVDLSRIVTLDPGDVIATGTPGGVGAARTPPEWLAVGREVRCSIDGLGELHNVCG